MFSSGSLEAVKKYYNEMAKPQIKISDLGAFNFAVMIFAQLIIFMVVLYIR